MRLCHNRRHRTWKGVTSGVLGGLAGALAMNLFQRGWAELSRAVSRPDHSSTGAASQSGEGESEDATMKAAKKLSQALLGRELSYKQKSKLGPVIHYSFGALTGGAYGALSEHVSSVRRGLGIPFGAVVFLTADEVAVPVVGLSKSPSEYSLSTHASSLAAHSVYGMTTEFVRNTIRHCL